MNVPRIGSFCSGIGGLDLAVAAHYNASHAWFCEYDPAPSKVLDHHWPDTLNHGDLTSTDWTAAEPVDIVTAGYPCQPFSTAGQRKGFDDERHIWPAIRDAISVLRPRVVVLENVRGHLSLGFDSVLGDLAGLGFDAEWGTFRSSDIGAPHRRERLYVVATVTDADSKRQRQFQKCDVKPQTGQQTPHRHNAVRYSVASVWEKYSAAIRRWQPIIGRPAPHPMDDQGRLNPELTEWMMGYPAGWVTDPAIGLTRRQQLKACGNAVQPQTAALALDMLSERLAATDQTIDA
jgi:DNA (cytosine-5)-methyltransferase 1